MFLAGRTLQMFNSVIQDQIKFFFSTFSSSISISSFLGKENKRGKEKNSFPRIIRR